MLYHLLRIHICRPTTKIKQYHQYDPNTYTANVQTKRHRVANLNSRDLFLSTDHRLTTTLWTRHICRSACLACCAETLHIDQITKQVVWHVVGFGCGRWCFFWSLVSIHSSIWDNGKGVVCMRNKRALLLHRTGIWGWRWHMLHQWRSIRC